MKIYSKFKDYYDIGLAYGIDEQCHYDRKTTEFECDNFGHRSNGKVPFNEADKLVNLTWGILKGMPGNSHYKRYQYDNTLSIKSAIPFVVVFCGKIYLGYEFHVAPNGKDKTLFAYTTDAIDDVVNKYCTKSEKTEFFAKKEKKGPWWSRSMGKKFTKLDLAPFFEEIAKFDVRKIQDYQAETKIPIMTVMNTTASWNPVLKDIEFYKVVDSYAAFQELSMYIGGVLGGHSPEMIEISDEIRIAKHGFNEWSFRKPPEQKS